MGGPGYCGGRHYECFDNFLTCSFVVGGKRYTSSEQCYQALKFADADWRETIRQAKSAEEAWRLGQSRAHALIPNFEERKEDLMYAANYAKFSQNKPLARVLCATGKKDITFMGSTPFWNAANSRVLRRVRRELQAMSLEARS